MNCKEHRLPELEITTGQVREALSAIIHSILLYVDFLWLDFVLMMIRRNSIAKMCLTKFVSLLHS